MLTNLDNIEKNNEAPNLKIATNKKIKGLLVSAIDESLLSANPISYNIERVFNRKKHLLPSKLVI
jgi:hypothetical protein